METSWKSDAHLTNTISRPRGWIESNPINPIRSIDRSQPFPLAVSQRTTISKKNYLLPSFESVLSQKSGTTTNKDIYYYALGCFLLNNQGWYDAVLDSVLHLRLRIRTKMNSLLGGLIDASIHSFKARASGIYRTNNNLYKKTETLQLTTARTSRTKTQTKTNTHTHPTVHRTWSTSIVS